MKKKIIILLPVVIILLMGIVVWFNIPLERVIGLISMQTSCLHEYGNL